MDNDCTNDAADESAGRIEGYLYTFGPSRAGSIYCLPTFCVLSGRRFAQLRHKGDLMSLRSGVLDSNHRVEDTGRQLVNGKVLYTIRLYSTSDYAKEVLLGAASAEEAAEWLEAFIFALGKQPLSSILDPWPITSPNMDGGDRSLVLATPRPKQKPNKSPTTIGKVNTPLLESGVPIPQPSPKWKLVRCENGLRFFQEINSGSKLPVVKAVGVVKGQADHIFDEVMNYGPERFQWDHTVETASVVEIVDGHSDVIHICLKKDWRWWRPRDFCLSRYWKREENGAYSQYLSTLQSRDIFVQQYTVTFDAGGGYIITPLNTSGKPKSLVESVFELDFGGWPFWGEAYSVHLRNNLLSVIAGIREYFAALRVDSSLNDDKLQMIEARDDPSARAAVGNDPPSVASMPFLETDLEDFFDARADVLSDSSEDHAEIMVAGPRNTEVCNGHALEKEFSLSKMKGTLAKGPPINGHNSYCEPDGCSFKVRSKFKDGSLIPAEEPFFKIVAVDWYKSKERLDHVSSQRSIIQKAPSKDLFFFTFNLQVPQSGRYYSLIFYFATKGKILESSLLHQFIHKDDEFRNQRLLLLPSVPEGSWIVRQAVGSRAVVLGQILECNYHRGRNYIEVDVNMGSSGIVRGVMGIVFGYISALVVDMGFSLRAETEDELPEQLIAAVRCSRLDLAAAVDEPCIT